jgi:hypothetical protein
MSLKSWLDEFYPIAASETMNALQAAEHSLQKWRGLRASNLKRHGLRRTVGVFKSITDNASVFRIDGLSCALCEFSRRAGNNHGEIDCGMCPLADVREGFSCEDPIEFSKGKDEVHDPYNWAFPLDVEDKIRPEPMIAWLEKTVEALKRDEGMRERFGMRGV